MGGEFYRLALLRTKHGIRRMRLLGYELQWIIVPKYANIATLG